MIEGSKNPEFVMKSPSTRWTNQWRLVFFFFFVSFSLGQKKALGFLLIHRKKKDGGCTFYHNTLRTKLSSLGIWKDMV